MTGDALSTPLGQDKRGRPRRKGLSLVQLLAAALGACVITFVGWALLVEDPLGGEPVAIAPVDLAGISNAPSKPGVPSEQRVEPSGHVNDRSEKEPPALTLPPTRTVTIIDGMSGRRQEVVIPGPAGPERQEQPSPASAAPGPVKGAAERGAARTISVR